MSVPSNGMKYSDIKLSEESIANEEYKKYLGGGKTFWEQRGYFQLYFMKSMGLMPEHKFLDIGCGPGRAGRYFIEYLNYGRYFGFDYNQDFIFAFKNCLAEYFINEKCPIIKETQEFCVEGIDFKADYAICFSVLNHCSQSDRAVFFKNIQIIFKPGARLYISHAKWFNQESIGNAGFEMTNVFDHRDYDISKHGWQPGESIFPIIELKRRR